ncbi:MAG: 5-formyltetrahydrofolate cyclo-ligase [Treponema sp.]|jgi:5-formyltetrahydrofolate cyclo-ligase|nr:5-formyltetrahydrofolate cyclo-ligase [Treponema sp.]
MQTKNELRKTMKALLAALPPDQFNAEGENAAGRFAETGVWKDSRRVLLYCSMPGETATAALINLAFREGKEMYFPKTEGNFMRFYRVDSPGGPWTTGAFGIREPADRGGERLFRVPGAVPEPFLVVTPGLAFDRTGCRLGRGGGYYDKFFAGLDAAHAVYCAAGYCLACQIVGEVPVESPDKRVNVLCTAGEFLAFY